MLGDIIAFGIVLLTIFGAGVMFGAGFAAGRMLVDLGVVLLERRVRPRPVRYPAYIESRGE